MKRYLLAGLGSLLTVVTQANADLFERVPQGDLVVASPNGKFSFKAVPAWTGRNRNVRREGSTGSLHRGADASGPAVWSVRLPYTKRPANAIVSDDGAYVATFDEFDQEGFGEYVVALFGANGRLLGHWGLEAFVAPHEREMLDGNRNSISWGGPGHRFDLSAGELVLDVRFSDPRAEDPFATVGRQRRINLRTLDVVGFTEKVSSTAVLERFRSASARDKKTHLAQLVAMKDPALRGFFKEMLLDKTTAEPLLELAAEGFAQSAEKRDALDLTRELGRSPELDRVVLHLLKDKGVTEAVPQLVDYQRRCKDPATRWLLLRVGKELGASDQVVAVALKDEDDEVRRAALDGLTELTPGIVDSLVTLLAHREPTVRREAHSALFQHASSEPVANTLIERAGQKGSQTQLSDTLLVELGVAAMNRGDSRNAARLWQLALAAPEAGEERVRINPKLTATAFLAWAAVERGDEGQAKSLAKAFESPRDSRVCVPFEPLETVARCHAVPAAKIGEQIRNALASPLRVETSWDRSTKRVTLRWRNASKEPVTLQAHSIRKVGWEHLGKSCDGRVQVAMPVLKMPLPPPPTIAAGEALVDDSVTAEPCSLPADTATRAHPAVLVLLLDASTEDAKGTPWSGVLRAALPVRFE